MFDSSKKYMFRSWKLNFANFLFKIRSFTLINILLLWSYRKLSFSNFENLIWIFFFNRKRLKCIFKFFKSLGWPAVHINMSLVEFILHPNVNAVRLRFMLWFSLLHWSFKGLNLRKTCKTHFLGWMFTLFVRISLYARIVFH